MKFLILDYQLYVYHVTGIILSLTPRFPVTDELLKPFLEGSTIQDLINKKRLFICDLALLDGVAKREGFVVSSVYFIFLFSSEKDRQ